MSKRFRAGLVVGKFCPLHLGHELVIRTALERCDRVFVLSWNEPELRGFEPERRARWLERRFPQTERLVLGRDTLARWSPPEEFATLPDNDVDLGRQRRFCAWICRRAFGMRPDAVFTSEDYGRPWADEMTRFFREEDANFPKISAVSVDPGRGRVPISGTRLRENIHAQREWLAPEVYADFVKRVVLLGGESTGKSSLSVLLARELETVSVAEYGRELWEQRGGQLVFEDLLRIGHEQIAREEAAKRSAREWLVCDTSPLTTLFYCRHLFGRADPELETLAEREYDRTILCAPDFPFVQDGTRQDEAFRLEQDAWYRRELARRAEPFLVASGPPRARIETILRELRKR